MFHPNPEKGIQVVLWHSWIFIPIHVTQATILRFFSFSSYHQFHPHLVTRNDIPVKGFGSLCCWREAAGLWEGRRGWWNLCPARGRWQSCCCCCWGCLPLCSLGQGDCRLAQGAPCRTPTQVRGVLFLLIQRHNKFLIISFGGAASLRALLRQGGTAARLAVPFQERHPLTLQPASSLWPGVLDSEGYPEPEMEEYRL